VAAVIRCRETSPLLCETIPAIPHMMNLKLNG
jgi:hypothetical protein